MLMPSPEKTSKIKKKLAYIPERNGAAGIQKDEFLKLVSNYIKDLTLEDEVKDDLANIFCYFIMKGFYAREADIIHNLAPLLKHVFDERSNPKDLYNSLSSGYSYPQSRSSLTQYLEIAKSETVRKRLLECIDTLRRLEFSKKIEKEKTPSIDWDAKKDKKKNT